MSNSTGRPAVRIRSRRQALDIVAQHLIGHVNGSTLEELSGISLAQGELTETERRRLEAAAEEITGRLLRLTAPSD
jgi:hypothetical protein